MKLREILFCSLVFNSIPVVFAQAGAPPTKVASAEEVTVVKAEKVTEVLKEDPKIVIVDIRMPVEFAAGHLANAVNIDFNSKDFEVELAKLDKDKTYLMHCRSGGRSTASLPIWKKLGFKKVLHLDSGILGIEKAGIELVKEKK